MNHINHPAKMAQQDPDFPDYDERGWPNPLVGVVLNVRDDALRLREGAARLIGKAPSEEVTFLLRLADSLDNGAAPAEKYMAETAGPGVVAVAPAADAEAVVLAIAAHIDGWKSATFGWQGHPDPAVAAQNQAAAVQAHAAECMRRIRATLAACAGVDANG